MRAFLFGSVIEPGLIPEGHKGDYQLNLKQVFKF